ncbi:MAG: RraA family protein [Pseudomonadota bacterium]
MTQPPVADLCDAYGSDARVLPGTWQRFTAIETFSGRAETIRLHGPDAALKDLLSTPGQGRVAVVDVAVEAPVAVFGEGMAHLAEQNGWAGIVICGHVRDVALIRDRRVGIFARGATPRIQTDGQQGEEKVEITCGAAVIRRGDWVVADLDGVVALDPALLKKAAA